MPLIYGGWSPNRVRRVKSCLSSLSNYIETILDDEEGLENYRPLRHYFTTACSRSGLPDDVIKMLVGWESSDMVSVYKDIDTDEELGKYFGADGIKQVSNKSLTDL